MKDEKEGTHRDNLGKPNGPLGPLGRFRPLVPNTPGLQAIFPVLRSSATSKWVLRLKRLMPGSKKERPWGCRSLLLHLGVGCEESVCDGQRSRSLSHRSLLVIDVAAWDDIAGLIAEVHAILEHASANH